MQKAFIATALALAAAASFAAPSSLVFDDDNTAVITGKPAKGSFLDEFLFEVPFAQSTVSSSLTTSINGNKNIDFSSITITNGSQTLYSFTQTAFDATGAEQWTLNNALLSAGTTYHLLLAGTSAVGGTRYSGDLSAVAAVPEPSTWAMALAGLAAVGAIARRRRA